MERTSRLLTRRLANGARGALVGGGAGLLFGLLLLPVYGADPELPPPGILASAALGALAGFVLGWAQNRSMKRLLLALSPLLVACDTRGGEAGPARDSCFQIELVSTEIRDHPLFNSPSDGRAVFQVTNRSDRPVGIYGTLGTEPVCRIAVQEGGRWIEDEPTWLTCCTGLEQGVLAPGATVDVGVWIPASGFTYRVAFGHWKEPAGEVPPWRRWNWTWSQPFAVTPP